MSKKNSKYKIMSFSVEQEHKDMMEEAMLQSGLTKSEIIRSLIKKHLNLVVNDGEAIPIIMRVPSDFRGDAQALKQWLDKKSDAIVKSLTQNQPCLTTNCA